MSRQQVSRMEAWAARLSRLSRLVRVVITAVIAILGAAAVSQFLSLVAGEAAFYDQGTVTTIYIVAAVVGLALYGAGYWSLLGFDREAHPVLGKRAVYFVMLGVVLGAALGVWLIISVVITLLPPEIPL